MMAGVGVGWGHKNGSFVVIYMSLFKSAGTSHLLFPSKQEAMAMLGRKQPRERNTCLLEGLVLGQYATNAVTLEVHILEKWALSVFSWVVEALKRASFLKLKLAA